MLYLTSVHSKFKTTVSNSEVIYVTENVYSMVLFSFQGNSNAEERARN